MRRCMRNVVVAAAIAIAPAPIASANDCATAMDQRTMNECADKSYEKSNAELNALQADQATP